MCYQVIEVYAVCGCIYFQHAIDQCASVNQSNHVVEKKYIPVGASCSQHIGAGASLQDPLQSPFSNPYPELACFGDSRGGCSRTSSIWSTRSTRGHMHY